MNGMAQIGNKPLEFLCDAMLGGLARWLRAAGYDAAYEYGIDDAELLRRARDQGRMVLSSDEPMFERTVLRTGEIPSLFIPRQLDKFRQLRFVLDQLGLPLRQPRCMACGGELAGVPRHRVMEEAPPLAFRNCEEFWRCRRCEKLFWHGTHWQKIRRKLAEFSGGTSPE
jgi:uncharacterized protein with PIN domain